MDKQVCSLIKYIEDLDGKADDKAKLSKLVQNEFALTKDRSVFYNDIFAIRFNSSKSTSFQTQSFRFQIFKNMMICHLSFV